jgi:hypothetical protein
LAAVVLSACSDREPELLNLRAATDGPDEFLILPTRPLEAPADFSALPPPTPGGRNLVDYVPAEDAVAALGGNPGALSTPGIPASDGNLVAQAGRYGLDRGIRQTLAAEDLEFRRVNNGRPLERLFNVNVYFKAYRRQSLDQYAELERLRRLGIKTASAPPDPAVQR